MCVQKVGYPAGGLHLAQSRRDAVAKVAQIPANPGRRLCACLLLPIASHLLRVLLLVLRCAVLRARARACCVYACGGECMCVCARCFGVGAWEGVQEREAELDQSMATLSWRERYIYFEFETHRTALSQDELEV